MTGEMLNCREVFTRLDDYVDRELSAAEARQVQDHLSRCANCSQEFAFETGLLTAIKDKLGRIPLPAELRDRVLRSLDQARREAGKENHNP